MCGHGLERVGEYVCRMKCMNEERRKGMKEGRTQLKGGRSREGRHEGREEGMKEGKKEMIKVARSKGME